MSLAGEKLVVGTASRKVRIFRCIKNGVKTISKYLVHDNHHLYPVILNFSPGMGMGFEKHVSCTTKKRIFIEVSNQMLVMLSK